MKNLEAKILKNKKATLKAVVEGLDIMWQAGKTNCSDLTQADFEYQTLLYKVRNFINAQGVTVDQNN